jgi:phosphatidyl-myo-inositol dimannoside synthase
MRILALVTDAFGAHGGIAQYNRDFVAALAACPGITEIDILPRRHRAEPISPPSVARQYPAVRDPIAYSVRAIALAFRRRPDVIFCGHLFMAPLAALLAKGLGAKLVVQTHGLEVWSRPKAFQRRAVEAADLVLCVSRDTRARVIGWTAIAPERVIVLPNTVSEAFSPGDGSALRAELGITVKTVLLSVSRLDAGQRHKGQDRVIRLIRGMRDRGHDIVFLIGGGGDDRARLEALARDEGVAEHVRFLGEVPDEQLPALYRAADLYVMPSSGEGFGIVFLEAMASGVPALGLAVGGAVDALVDGMAVSEPDLEAMLAKCLSAPRPDPEALAAKTRARFGRPVFQAGVAKMLARLGAPEQAIKA